MTRQIRTGMVAAVAAASLVVVAPEATATRPSPAKRYGAKAPERARRGRPRKFSRPARAVTLTLPEDVIVSLQAVDRDLSRAVVRLAQTSALPPARDPVELSAYGEHAVIIVPPNRMLKERTGIELVPLSDGGALISFDQGVSIPQFELRLGDALADPGLAADDRMLFEALADILRRGRLADGIALRERRIIIVKLPKGGAKARQTTARSA